VAFYDVRKWNEPILTTVRPHGANVYLSIIARVNCCIYLIVATTQIVGFVEL